MISKTLGSGELKTKILKSPPTSVGIYKLQLHFFISWQLTHEVRKDMVNAFYNVSALWTSVTLLKTFLYAFVTEMTDKRHVWLPSVFGFQIKHPTNLISSVDQI